MKRLIIITFIWVFISHGLSAQPKQISTNEARFVAISRVASQTNYPKSDISVINIASCSNENGNVLIYEIATDKGFTVLLSGSRTCKPILGVHGNGEGMLLDNYDILPCGLRFLLDWYKSQISDSFQDNTIESSNTNEWQLLLNEEAEPISRPNGVPPLLQSNWAQYGTNNANDDGYNYLMPPGEGCNHCVAGCVAVAMGQVMYYWKYPVLIHHWDTQLDWCNMTDYLDTSELTYGKNKVAISDLLLRCGKSVNMDYGCAGSSAHTEDSRDALVDFFYYSSDAEYKNRLWHSNDGWKEMIKNSLDREMPVIYKGRSSMTGGTGHAFVCDGYNEHDEFHFNWGWANFHDENGYYTLDNLNPNGNNYNFRQGAIFKIKPAEESNVCESTLDLDFFFGFHTSHNHPIYTATPKTMNKLISASLSSPSSWRTIPSGAEAEYVAHTEVVLRPGFTAEYGSNFTVRIEPCDNCGNRNELNDINESDETRDSLENRMLMPNSSNGYLDTVAVNHSNLLMFPIPAKELLTVCDVDKMKTIGIYDMGGKNVFRWFITSNIEGKLVLNVSKLRAGLYILRIETEKGVIHTGRFIKE